LKSEKKEIQKTLKSHREIFVYKAKIKKNFTIFLQNKDFSALLLEEKSYILFIVLLGRFGGLTMLFEEEEEEWAEEEEEEE
jgi:hypothetical protein